MTKKRNLIVPALVLGVLLAIVAVVYFVEPAGSLPSVLPGHEAGSAHHHIKHASPPQPSRPGASPSRGSRPSRPQVDLACPAPRPRLRGS